MLSDDYVIGLTDGEGSFTVYLNTSKRRRAKVEPRFYLKLKADDKSLLDKLVGFFRCGKVYIQRDKRPRHRLCYRFEVSNRKDLMEKIIPFFQNHSLRSPTKRADFRLFSQAMEIIKKNKHLTPEGYKEIKALIAMMHRGSLNTGNPYV